MTSRTLLLKAFVARSTRLSTSSAHFWILMLGSLLHAAASLSDGVQDAGSAAHSRGLRDHNEGEIAHPEAAQILLQHGVADFGAIVHTSRSPTAQCQVEQLEASAVGQLFDLCVQIDKVHNCTATASPERGSGVGTGATVFRFLCRNDTCIDAWPPALTDCMIGTLLGDSDLDGGIALAGMGCDQATLGAVQREGERGSKAGILDSVGQSNAFGCLTGLPHGAAVSTSTRCAGRRFQTDVMLRLKEGGFVEGADYGCIWAGRCRKSETCCENGQSFEGIFICYLAEGQSVGLSTSAAVPRARWAPIVALASGISAFWHLILSLAL
eukprot:evm.model.scf_146.3 EVM.evm.TU.scf_146.3   scf_146:88905-91490(-)